MANLKEIKTGMTETAKFINENFEKLNDNALNVLSKGFWYMNGQTTIKPSKTIMDCKTGWLLQWEATTDGATKAGASYHYYHVPKAVVMAEGAGSGGGSVPIPLFAVTGGQIGSDVNSILKTVYVSNTGITGHSNNSLEKDANGKGTRHWVMTAVYEY